MVVENSNSYSLALFRVYRRIYAVNLTNFVRSHLRIPRRQFISWVLINFLCEGLNHLREPTVVVKPSLEKRAFRLKTGLGELLIKHGQESGS